MKKSNLITKTFLLDCFKDSILKFSLKNKDFHFMHDDLDYVFLEIYFDNDNKPVYNDYITNIKSQQNNPEKNNKFLDLVIPENSKKAKIIISSYNDFDLKTISVKCVKNPH